MAGNRPTKRPDRTALGASIANCSPCGKWLYADRRSARAASARMHDRMLREYPCPHQSSYWHIGHLPQATVAGRKTAAEVYRTVEVPDA